MKRKPKSGYYLRRLNGEFKGKSPRISAQLRKKNPREANRRKGIRALYRRIMTPQAYKEMAKWVRSIRHRLGVTQKKFAAMVGVSVVTLQRWEYAQGHMPGGWTTKNVHGRKVVSNMQRLKQLEKLADDLEKSGTPFEE